MRKLYTEEPFDNIIKFELARVLIRFEDTLNEGRNYLLELLLHTSNRSYAMLELGKLEARLGNYEEAKSYFTDLIYLGGQSKTYAMLELGKLEASVGNYEDAKSCFTKLLETIDIEKTLSFVEKSITESAPLQLSFVDKYNIDCGNIVGVNNDVETSFVEAVTFPNTKDIIAMYPVIGIKKKNLKNVGRRLVYNRKKS